MIDLQSTSGSSSFDLNKVGIKSLRHPVKVRNEDGSTQAVVANFDMMVRLPSTQRGTHMSRFIETLHQEEWVLSLSCIEDMLFTVAKNLNATHAYIDCAFDFFIKKAAPISRVAGFLDYQVELSGRLDSGSSLISLTVHVPVTTLCPCSKEISAYGAHNQRSIISVTIQASKTTNIEYLIRLIEKLASCEIYSILKRVDEKFVTEQAYDHPNFVEDIVRNIAAALKKNVAITGYRVISENYESIHNHSAYAMLEENLY